MFKKVKRKIKEFKRWKACHRIFSWPAYGKWVGNVKQDKSQFVPFTESPFIRKEDDVKIFAYYLTQFHSIPENDEAYGKGFTEWTNVASAQPHFVGHYQPKIPYDLGFYNLLMPGIMERQVEMAKAYGIYGFCFYYYWFSGKRVLEKPLEYLLAHKEIDFHYHFCWANENWSKLWDGGNMEVILEQKLQDGDAELFFKDVLPYFNDNRYEKIDNKPMLMVYRPSHFPISKFIQFINTLNSLAREHGFNGLYITISNRNYVGEDGNPSHYGNDIAQTEFPPHGVFDKCREIISIKRLIPDANFVVLDTTEFINKKLYMRPKPYKVFKGCMTSWDNTPRKAMSYGTVFLLSEEQFKTWLLDILLWTKSNHTLNEQYVYINAWNEWGEGAILEPTLRYGYKYLEIVKQCLECSRTLSATSLTEQFDS